MRIGGFVKQSFVDWPGRMAAVVFTKGCNFRCGYCHNPSLVLPQLINQSDDFSLTEILTYLEQRKNWLEGVVITGGEPTLHKDLPAFIVQIREMGYPVKLDTNGSNPEMLQLLLQENLIDFVTMDIKHLPDGSSYQKVTGCRIDMENILTSIGLIRNAGIKCQFRTTALPWIHTSEVLQSIRNMVAPMDYVVNEYKEAHTVDRAVMEKYLADCLSGTFNP